MEFEHDIDGLFQTYQSLLPMKPEDKARLWQKFRLDWNYNSNRIEGNTLTYGETEALLILGTEPKRLEKDIREMKAHDVGIEHLRNLARDERPISEADVRELNRIILKENYFIETETAEGNISRKEIVPGTYKTMPNHVRLRGGGIHKFAEPHEVPQRMEAVVKSIRNYVSKPANQPLAEYLAELHQDFINTHPFDDGNGRVVRMLMNYVCLKLSWPPIIIKNAKKTEYLTALEQWDKGEKEPLRLLMNTELMWSLDKSVKAARGEDIEDPDDIDKEVDIFVGEWVSNAYEPNDYAILSTAFSAVTNRILELFTKFESVFETTLYNEDSQNTRVKCPFNGKEVSPTHGLIYEIAFDHMIPTKKNVAAFITTFMFHNKCELIVTNISFIAGDYKYADYEEVPHLGSSFVMDNWDGKSVPSKTQINHYTKPLAQEFMDALKTFQNP